MRTLIIKGNLICKDITYKGFIGQGCVKSNIPLSEITDELLNKAIIIEGNVNIESDLCVDYQLIVTGGITIS